MAKQKRKLTAREKAEKKRRRLEYMTIFINGKQKRVKRPQTIDGMPVEEFIRRNADPIWLHQNEYWEYLTPEDEVADQFGNSTVWDDSFDSDRDALDAALNAIEEDGIDSLIGLPSDWQETKVPDYILSDAGFDELDDFFTGPDSSST